MEDHEKIYEKLISILNVKFKTQLKGTEIYFKSFYQLKNLISDKEDYLLILNENKSIQFCSNREFYENLIHIIKTRINNFNSEYNDLQNRSQNDAVVDDHEIYMRHEHIGYCGERLIKLLKKMREFLEQEKY